MKSNRFLIKALPELLIATIPAFVSIITELLKARGIKTGILWGFPSTFFFMAIIVLTSLIVSAWRDQEGWMKHEWPIHCVLIALAFPVVEALWIPFSFHFTKRLPDSAPFWDLVACILLASALLASSLLLGLCVRLVLFSRFMVGKLAFRTRIVIVSFLSFFFSVSLFVLAGGLEPRKTFDQNPDRFDDLSFTYDGKAIVFARKNGTSDTQIQTYDLQSGELALYVPPQGELWTMPRCSSTGRQMVFVVQPPSEFRHPDTTQIATMNTDGSEYRLLTNSGGYKSYPALSYSGRTVIYGKDENVGGTGNRDIYEADVTTRAEKRITDFGFLVTLFLQYLPDGKQFSFTGDRSSFLSRTQGAELQLDKYSGRNIYVMRLDNPELEPLPLRRDRLGRLISAPGPLLVDNNGAMFFCDLFIKDEGKRREDWQQCYAYSSEGIHRLIANIKAVYLSSAAISPDGRKLAIVYRTEQNDHERIAIYSVDTGQRKDVAIPRKPVRYIQLQ